MQDQASQFLNPEYILKQANIQPGSKVGDLGCGTGYMSFAAARLIGEKGKVYAVDVQRSVLEQVKKEARMENIKNIEVAWSDLEILGATKIAPASLDVVFLVNTLFQVKQKQAVVSEAKRLLKQGGNLLVIDWKSGDTSIGPPVDRRIDLANIRQIMTEQGFVEQKEINTGKYHFGILFKNT